ncbi:twin arginine-targeting protein translocase TatB [Pseudoroseomonas deserti]|uniref:Sec-independent protein translocase protein TatB n=1 Tax=Teichococcus deserti TaxID=1817963 RepID=A0A1V2H5Z5_9PROT|nr:Sec-independent protein translocase protein TatB [Pseudoroseomonas deserti]ONG56144.1 twin arginine-targeting protein translocase TatB [Pseudoroseomonas deserti]
MFDLAWSEIALIAVVAVVVIGPKDLPDAVRQVAKGVQKLRRMASEFQSQADELVREAKLEDVRDQIRDIRNFDVKGTIERHLDEDGGIRKTFSEDPLRDAWKPGPGGIAEPPAGSSFSTEALPPVPAAAPQPPADAPSWVPPSVAAEIRPPSPPPAPPAPEPAAPPAMIPPGMTETATPAATTPAPVQATPAEARPAEPKPTEPKPTEPALASAAPTPAAEPAKTDGSAQPATPPATPAAIPAATPPATPTV